MGTKHDKGEILAAALTVALSDGLSQLTYGRVARHLGIADRTVVYYFRTKDELIEAVLVAMGLQIQETLAAAVDEPSHDYMGLLRTAWPVLAHPDVDPLFCLFFEANGLAAAGRDPYQSLVPTLVEVWISWAAGYVTGSLAERREEAEAAIALLDGLLLLRQLAAIDAAECAARKCGIC